MHSGSLERTGTPRKKTLSRAMSEDESLRNIIKEGNGSSRRLIRSDSRMGGQSEEELSTGFLEMPELQASYDNAMQELRAAELQKEVLTFQVDCLQDALEGTEEMLAEVQREVNHAYMELDGEREAKRKLEDVVSALSQELSRLKEERKSVPVVPVVPVYSLQQERENHKPKEEKGSETEEGKEGDNKEVKGERQEEKRDASKEEGDFFQDAPLSLIRLDGLPAPEAQRKGSTPENGSGGFLSFFRKGKGDPPADGPAPLHRAHMGSSVDLEDTVDGSAADSMLGKFQKMLHRGQVATLPLVQGEELSLSPEQNYDTDNLSTYEDASSETPVLEEDFPRSSTPDGALAAEGAASPGGDEEDEEVNSGGMDDHESRKPGDSCAIS